MSHRGLEIAPCVAIAARHAAVLAEQRKRRPGVIESFELRHPRPTRSVVAGFARALEAALMRIVVAAGARRKGKTDVLGIRFGIGDSRVALSARNRRVRSRQWEFRRRVIES